MITLRPKVLNDIASFMIEEDVGESRSWVVDYRDETFDIEVTIEEEKYDEVTGLKSLIWDLTVLRLATAKVSLRGGGETTLLVDVTPNDLENAYYLWHVMEKRIAEDTDKRYKGPEQTILGSLRQRFG